MPFYFPPPRDRRPMSEQGKLMAEIVKNIALESEKCDYRPKKDTNWLDLPEEMQEECLKWMDLKTRIKMRRTSKTEKTFVEAHKYLFDKMLIDINIDAFRFMMRDTAVVMKLSKLNPLSPCGKERIEPTRTNENGFIDRIHSPLALKFCEFREVECSSFFNILGAETFLEPCAPFRFKRLRSDGNLEIARLLLKNCEGGVEDVRIKFDVPEDCWIYYRTDPFRESFSEYRSFITAKRVVFEHMPYENLVPEAKKLAKKWSEHDVEIGTKCHFSTQKLGFLIRGDNKRHSMFKMNNKSKVVYSTYRINSRTRGEIVMSVIRRPSPEAVEAQGTR